MTAPDARATFGGGIAVITGAGAGIGAGLARHAHRIGMTVVLVDVDERAATTLRNDLVADGGNAHVEVCDVRDAEAMVELAERVYRDIGPVRPFARGLVMVEQLAGLAYVAMLVSRLVALTVRRDMH